MIKCRRAGLAKPPPTSGTWLGRPRGSDAPVTLGGRPASSGAGGSLTLLAGAGDRTDTGQKGFVQRRQFATHCIAHNILRVFLASIIVVKCFDARIMVSIDFMLTSLPNCAATAQRERGHARHGKLSDIFVY